MMADPTEVRKIVRQNLQTEALFGIKEIPLSRGELAAWQAASQAASPAGSRPSSGAADAPAGDSERAAELRTLDEQQVRGCQKCGLASTRNNTVFGQGDPNARLVFVTVRVWLSSAGPVNC